jgi:1-acyl-sn-glycerol-3-phosphate acyltransferase
MSELTLKPSPVRAAGQWAYLGVSGLAMLGPALFAAPFSPPTAYRLLRGWARRQLAQLGIELTVDDRSGYDGRRGVLFVDLHQQTLLTALIYPLVLPTSAALIVNAEFVALPLLGWLTIGLGAMPIVRQRPAQARAQLKQAAVRLKAGQSFGISIEGRRTADGGLSPYKKGPAVLAIDAQCDIIPYMSFGEYRLWPRGEWRVRPGRVECVLYPPVPTMGLKYEHREVLVESLWKLAKDELKARGFSAPSLRAAET